MDGFVERLMQRKIVQWALAYLAGAFAISDNPYGPFTYQGQLLTPVVGRTTHHSICEFRGNWYLFYHDAILSGGESHLRSVKVTKLRHDAHGRIATIHPYGQ